MLNERNKVYFIISKNNLLIEEKIKELSLKNIRFIFNKDSQETFLSLQRNLNQRLTDEKFDIIIKNTEKLNNDDLKRLVLIIKDTRQNVFFICHDEPTELISLLRKNKIRFEIIRLNTPTRKELRGFILGILRKRNLQLSPAIIDLLVENYSDKIDLLIQDLNKIFFLEDKITPKNLRYILSLVTNNFKIHDLFLSRNWPEFIHHFKKFISEDKSKDHFETLKLLSLLSNSLMRIFLIKHNKKIKANPYYLNKLTKVAQNISLEEIKRLQTSLAKTERKLKKFFLNIKDIPEDIYLNYLLRKA